MTTSALLVTLLAALVHAGSADPQARVGVAMLVGTLATMPLAAVGFRWDAAAWPYVAFSVAFELAYVVLLTAAYELRKRGGGLGAVALCGGGGQGEAILFSTPAS